MIVAMKKAAIIFQQKDSSPALEELRGLGLLHIEYQKPPQSQDINILQEELSLLNGCGAVFNQATGKNKKIEPAAAISGDWKIKARHIIELGKRYDQLETYSRSLAQQISEWERWGDFEPQKIQQLAEKGIYIRLYQVSLRQVKDFPSGVFVNSLFMRAGLACCVTVSLSKFECPFKEVVLPKQGLLAMRARLAEEEKVIEAINHDINRHLDLVPAFIEAGKRLEKEIEFQQVIAGLSSMGTISYVAGYLPFDAVGKLQAKAKEKSWGVVIRDPAEEDIVPTLLRNSRWISIISPVFKLLEIIPGYRELDISPLFLLFLSLFFGMIIGDAGYGAIYFSLTFLIHLKLRKKYSDQRIFFLFYLFSACAIFWGVLTGTVFGHEWYLQAGMKPLIPILNDTKFIQAFCFLLGAIHLTLAQGWQAARKFPSLTVLADIGWICVLWAAFFLAKTLILSDPLPIFTNWLIITGLSLVVICTSPQRNIFKMLGQGVASVALSVMNNFTDVVSYIRLFAVGLAGVAIADTVNMLAATLGSGNAVAKIIILALGHTINIILGPLSVMVHGIRLNVLEFSSHAGLTWSGVAYKPFKELEKGV